MKPIDETLRPLVEQVFDSWKTILNHPRAKLITQPKSQKLIQKYLENGVELEDFLLCFYGVAVDPWPDRVHHNSLEIILREGNFDKFVMMGEQAQKFAEQEQERLDKAKQIVERRAEPRGEMPAQTVQFLAAYKSKMRVA